MQRSTLRQQRSCQPKHRGSAELSLDLVRVVPQQQLPHSRNRMAAASGWPGEAEPAAATRTTCRSAAIDGVMKARTIRVSKSRPRPIVVPICPRIWRSLKMNAAIVAANKPGRGHDGTRAAIARMMPVLIPASSSSLNREINSKL